MVGKIGSYIVLNISCTQVRPNTACAKMLPVLIGWFGLFACYTRLHTQIAGISTIELAPTPTIDAKLLSKSFSKVARVNYLYNDLIVKVAPG